MTINNYNKLHEVLADWQAEVTAKDYATFLPQLINALLGIEDKVNELVSFCNGLERRIESIGGGK
jgi:hypothetical protein